MSWLRLQKDTPCTKITVSNSISWLKTRKLECNISKIGQRWFWMCTRKNWTIKIALEILRYPPYWVRKCMSYSLSTDSLHFTVKIDGKWLQQKRCFCIAISLPSFASIVLPVRDEISTCSQIRTLKGYTTDSWSVTRVWNVRSCKLCNNK